MELHQQLSVSWGGDVTMCIVYSHSECVFTYCLVPVYDSHRSRHIMIMCPAHSVPAALHPGCLHPRLLCLLEALCRLHLLQSRWKLSSVQFVFFSPRPKKLYSLSKGKWKPQFLNTFLSLSLREPQCLSSCTSTAICSPLVKGKNEASVS